MHLTIFTAPIVLVFVLNLKLHQSALLHYVSDDFTMSGAETKTEVLNGTWLLLWILP